MKNALSEIADTLEEALTGLAAAEALLTQRGLLEVGELDRLADSERLPQRLALGSLRHLISSLPD